MDLEFYHLKLHCIDKFLFTLWLHSYKIYHIGYKHNERLKIHQFTVLITIYYINILYIYRNVNTTHLKSMFDKNLPYLIIFLHAPNHLHHYYLPERNRNIQFVKSPFRIIVINAEMRKTLFYKVLYKYTRKSRGRGVWER